MRKEWEVVTLGAPLIGVDPFRKPRGAPENSSVYCMVSIPSARLVGSVKCTLSLNPCYFLY